MQLPDSPRFHIVDANQVLPPQGTVAPRPLYVYLPAAALQHRRRKFPVLYCQDGQNLWDDPHACFGHGGWYLNRICDELTDFGKMAPVVLVGIPNSAARYREYTPGASFEAIDHHPYARYLRDAVKPYIERHFPVRRSRESVALLGSSLGGLVSLWISHHWPWQFGKAACLSGAFQVRDRQRQNFLGFLSRRAHQSLRLYVDNGTVDDGQALSRRVVEAYRARGWRDGEDLLHIEQAGGEHNERCWRDRVWRALVFLFPPRSSA